MAKIWWSTYSFYSIKLKNVSLPLLLYSAFSCLEIVMFSKLKDSALSPTKNPGQFSNLLLLEARKTVHNISGDQIVFTFLLTSEYLSEQLQPDDIPIHFSM